MSRTAQEPARLPELDALRGLAALSVVLGHLCLLGSTESTSRLGVFLYSLYPYPMGHDAVILFFVLSGFVLALPAVDGRPQPYPVFFIRRVFRIYPAYWFSLALAVLGCAFLRASLLHGDWLTAYWSGGVSFRQVLHHLLLIDRMDIDQFNPVVWTLIHEMRISVVFPLLCALVLRLRPVAALTSAIAVSAVLEFQPGVITAADDAPLLTVHYAMFFVLGIVLACERVRLATAVGHMGRFQKIASGAVLAIVYVFAGDLPFQGRYRWTERESPLLVEWVTALAAAGLIVFALGSPRMRSLLAWRPVRLLAKMSYSLYLLHFVVLLAAVRLLYGHMPLTPILLICLVVSLGAGWCAYVGVEAPSIRLGRRVSNRWLARDA